MRQPDGFPGADAAACRMEGPRGPAAGLEFGVRQEAYVEGGILRLPAAGLELPLALIFDLVRLEPSDIVIACGSLVEGTGNAFSDLDLYLISHREMDARRATALSLSWRTLTRQRDIVGQPARSNDPPSSDVFLVHIPVPECYSKVDVEFRTVEEVKAIGRQVASLYEYATENLELFTKPMDPRDKMLVHRLTSGLVLHGDEAAKTLQEALNIRQFSYLLYRWVASDFSILIDALGAWTKQEFDRCALIMREKLALEMFGLLNLCGVTTQNQKWLLTIVNQPPSGASFAVFERDASLRHDFAAAFGAADWSTRKKRKNYVLHCADLMDRIYSLVRARLAETGFPAGQVAIEKLKRAIGSVDDCGYAALELEHRLLAYEEGPRATRDLFEVQH